MSEQNIFDRIESGQQEQVVIDEDLCIGCGKCLQSCPTDVFGMTKVGSTSVAEVRYPGDCCSCHFCEMDCPTKAIRVNYDTPNHGFVSIYDRMGIALPIPDSSVQPN